MAPAVCGACIASTWPTEDRKFNPAPGVYTPVPAPVNRPILLQRHPCPRERPSGLFARSRVCAWRLAQLPRALHRGSCRARCASGWLPMPLRLTIFRAPALTPNACEGRPAKPPLATKSSGPHATSTHVKHRAARQTGQPTFARTARGYVASPLLAAAADTGSSSGSSGCSASHSSFNAARSSPTF
jgi:hypothetical protein